MEPSIQEATIAQSSAFFRCMPPGAPPHADPLLHQLPGAPPHADPLLHLLPGVLREATTANRFSPPMQAHPLISAHPLHTTTPTLTPNCERTRWLRSCTGQHLHVIITFMTAHITFFEFSKTPCPKKKKKKKGPSSNRCTSKGASSRQIPG
jgi:hypothetical protein